MTYPLPTQLENERLPVEYIEEVGGLYFRAINLEKLGDVVKQHTHDFEHVTCVCSGAVRVWVGGEWKGDIIGFKAIVIAANKAHTFQALEPNTRLACVHQLNGAQYAVGG